MDVQEARRIGESLGFGLVGVAPAATSEYGREMREWLADDKHGEMDYLARHLDTRLDPAQLVPDARSVIVVADFYDTPGSDIQKPKAEVPLGRIARYARGNDYHKVIKKRLHRLADALREHAPAETFRAAVDTAPIMEREHAARAGLGWIGKHTLLIHPRKGSWMLLGVIVTTLDLGVDQTTHPPAEAGSAISGGHCGTCTRCIDACPTDCITPYSVDASRCISYLTLEHRSSIDPALHAPMGDWVAGCDVCQEVCPYNHATTGGVRDQSVTINPAYAPRPAFDPGPPLLELLGWSAEDRQQAFIKSALKRIKLDMLKRNALIAAGNALARQNDNALRSRIAALAEDGNESELVRDTARQVLAKLDQGTL